MFLFLVELEIVFEKTLCPNIEGLETCSILGDDKSKTYEVIRN